MKYAHNSIFGNYVYESNADPIYTYSMPVKSEPHKCPVCEGRGQMPFSFYERQGMTGNITSAVICKSCGGKGIVWKGDE